MARLEVFPPVADLVYVNYISFKCFISEVFMFSCVLMCVSTFFMSVLFFAVGKPARMKELKGRN